MKPWIETAEVVANPAATRVDVGRLDASRRGWAPVPDRCRAVGRNDGPVAIVSSVVALCQRRDRRECEHRNECEY